MFARPTSASSARQRKSREDVGFEDWVASKDEEVEERKEVEASARAEEEEVRRERLTASKTAFQSWLVLKGVYEQAVHMLYALDSKKHFTTVSPLRAVLPPSAGEFAGEHVFDHTWQKAVIALAHTHKYLQLHHAYDEPTRDADNEGALLGSESQRRLRASASRSPHRRSTSRRRSSSAGRGVSAERGGSPVEHAGASPSHKSRKPLSRVYRAWMSARHMWSEVVIPTDILNALSSGARDMLEQEGDKYTISGLTYVQPQRDPRMVRAQRACSCGRG